MRCPRPLRCYVVRWISDQFVSVWVVPAAVVVVPLGVAAHLDVLGWIAAFMGVFVAFGLHDTMREVSGYGDAVDND